MIIFLPAGRAATEGPESDIQATQIATWKRKLQKSGASAAELDKFEQISSVKSKHTYVWFSEFLRKNPPQKVLGLLRTMLRYEHEERPPDIFPNAAPAIGCEELRSVSIRDTT